MFVYNLLATLYLSYLGLEGTSVGVLLWPAGALHLVLTALLASDRLATDEVRRILMMGRH